MAAGAGKASTHPTQRHTPARGHPRAGHTIRINDPRSPGLEQWDTVFAPGARVDYSVAGGPQLKDIPYKDLVDVMRAPDGSMSGLLKWQHFQGFSTVDIEGDRAVARTQHLHTRKGGTDGQGWNLIQTGFFVDRLERRPEGWRIIHRTLEIIWMETPSPRCDEAHQPASPDAGSSPAYSP